MFYRHILLPKFIIIYLSSSTAKSLGLHFWKHRPQVIDPHRLEILAQHLISHAVWRQNSWKSSSQTPETLLPMNINFSTVENLNNSPHFLFGRRGEISRSIINKKRNETLIAVFFVRGRSLLVRGRSGFFPPNLDDARRSRSSTPQHSNRDNSQHLSTSAGSP